MRRIWFLPGLTFCVFFLFAGVATAFAGAPVYGLIFEIAAFAFGLLAWWATPSDPGHPSKTDRYPIISIDS
jgi:hypothetical protein